MTRWSSRLAAVLACGLACPALVAGQGVERLSLEEAMARAQVRSTALEAMVHRVEELEYRSAGARANYFPRLETQFLYRTFESSGEIPEGLGGGLSAGLTTLSQPVTQLLAVRMGRGAALAEADAARAGLRKARADVAVATLRLYGGLLIARFQLEVAEARLAAAEVQASEQQAATEAGRVLPVAALEARVRILEARQARLEAEGLIQDLEYELADLLGFPPGTTLEVVNPEPVGEEPLPLEVYLEQARRENPELLEALATIRRAEHGVAAARADYIPQVGVGVSHLYQSSFSFLPRNSFGLALQLSWAPFDFGRRGAVVGERRSQLAQARANAALVEGRIRGEVERAHRQVEHAGLRVHLAREAHGLRMEAARLREGQERAGVVTSAEARSAGADALQGAVELLQAEMGYRLALAELRRSVGGLLR